MKKQITGKKNQFRHMEQNQELQKREININKKIANEWVININKVEEDMALIMETLTAIKIIKRLCTKFGIKLIIPTEKEVVQYPDDDTLVIDINEIGEDTDPLMEELARIVAQNRIYKRFGIISEEPKENILLKQESDRWVIDIYKIGDIIQEIIEVIERIINYKKIRAALLVTPTDVFTDVKSKKRFIDLKTADEEKALMMYKILKIIRKQKYIELAETELEVYSSTEDEKQPIETKETDEDASSILKSIDIIISKKLYLS